MEHFDGGVGTEGVLHNCRKEAESMLSGERAPGQEMAQVAPGRPPRQKGFSNNGIQKVIWKI